MRTVAYAVGDSGNFDLKKVVSDLLKGYKVSIFFTKLPNIKKIIKDVSGEVHRCSLQWLMGNSGGRTPIRLDLLLSVSGFKKDRNYVYAHYYSDTYWRLATPTEKTVPWIKLPPESIDLVSLADMIKLAPHIHSNILDKERNLKKIFDLNK